MVKKNQKHADVKFYKYIRSTLFQRVAALILTWLALSAVVSYEAAPKKYKLEVGDVSIYDIQAPRDIENKVKTKENAEKKAAELTPVVIEISNANSDMLNGAYEYFDGLEQLIRDVNDSSPEVLDDAIKQIDTGGVYGVLFRMEESDRKMLFSEEGLKNLQSIKDRIIKNIIPSLTQKKLMEENLENEKLQSIKNVQSGTDNNLFTMLADDVLNKVLKPNSKIDEQATKAQRDEFIESYTKENPVIIYNDERIISKDDVVTEDKYEVLKELNYIDREGKPDYLLYAAVCLIILVLIVIAMIYLRNFHPKLFYDRNSVWLICIIILIATFFAWVTQNFVSDYSHLIIPITIAPVLVAIFLGVEPALTVNLLLTFSFSLMLGGNFEFMLMSLVSGSLAAFFTVNATQRRKISLAGVVLGGINAFIILLSGLISKKSLESILNDGGLTFLAGIFSMVLAIGLMPFLESSFNLITPLKLLELADPNHPLLKRLLMEAPGTYHHSLMVGNLAEVAARDIGGNAILARVGAYYHDVGKLKRPQFFKENQIGNNPHDKLTPNLSALVIISHTKDGDELAQKYHLPKVIRDIILQHHGTTLMVYFYHKATQTKDELKEETFRYEGPIPDTREAAVVMLADSVEAAIRSMPDKTQGKMEGLVHKIIKDKLDDGQLDRCDLTLKDLSIIADSFMQVLSGVFHERIEYPDLEKKNSLLELDNSIYNIKGQKSLRRDSPDEIDNIQPSEDSENTQ